MRYAAGTMNTVTATETSSPPMIARASGAYASLPAPSFSAIGSSIGTRKRAGAQVTGLAVLLELSFLNGRARLADLPVSALLTV